jgi:hypothetical protein
VDGNWHDWIIPLDLNAGQFVIVYAFRPVLTPYSTIITNRHFQFQEFNTDIDNWDGGYDQPGWEPEYLSQLDPLDISPSNVQDSIAEQPYIRITVDEANYFNSPVPPITQTNAGTRTFHQYNAGAGSYNYSFGYIITKDFTEAASNPSPADEEEDVEWDLTNSIAAPIRDDGYLSEGDGTGKWLCPWVSVLVRDNESNETPPNGYREPRAGDVLYNDTNGDGIYYVYRVERKRLVNTNYEYEIFALRVGDAGAGGFLGSGDVLTNNVIPDKENPQAVKVIMEDRFLSGDDSEIAWLPQGVTIQWQIDSVFPDKTRTGPTWEFTTRVKKYFRNYTLVPTSEGGSGFGPDTDGSYPAGVEGPDWNLPNSNILVAIAKNALWYEDKI